MSICKASFERTAHMRCNMPGNALRLLPTDKHADDGRVLMRMQFVDLCCSRPAAV